jgi:hypothetical protein
MTALMSGVRAMGETGYDQTWLDLDYIKFVCVWYKSHLTY